MTKKSPMPSLGSEEPLKPAHSLPRYSEPTPETHRPVSREEEAEFALQHTIFTPGACPLLIVLFLLTIGLVPTLQWSVELGAGRATAAKPNLAKAYPSWDRIRSVRNVRDLWRLLPRGADLKAAEKSMESASVVSEWLLPRVQAVLTGMLRVGNEQVYTGRDKWLFYRPDVDYVTGLPFLDATHMRHRAHIERIEPDPVKAILGFHKQLATRGIDLIVMPVPTKPGVDALRFSRRADPSVPLQNPSFLEFKTRLESGGVQVFDPGPLLIQRKRVLNEAALYLETDTHWRPETMEYLAENLARLIRSAQLDDRAEPLQIVDKQIGSLGDTARMLRLPSSQEIYRAQELTIHQIFSGNRAWHPSKESDILLLGDSFSNIYSLDALGWGEAAGLAEHLSHALHGEPIDCILRNSDGAFATRELLARDLARGRDRLAGKKVVIWEFAARELTFGNWKSVDLTLGESRPTRFFVPKAGNESLASATVEEISDVPRPGTVPYRDHIASIHVSDLQFANRTAKEPLECLVYLQSMRDNILTPAAHLRPGDRIRLRLRPWSDVAEQFEKMNRSELDDRVIQLEEPCWGEIIP